MKHLSGNKYLAIGTMSGTSLDGLDLAAVEFSFNGYSWNFNLKEAETITYTDEWEDKLKNSPTLPATDLLRLHNDYGKFIGQQINHFILSHHLKPDLIASHGHTIYHQPHKGYTFQLGHGSSIAAVTGIQTISDFRSGDVALGGQGAPLVPVGDKLLFADYDACLNLGGFANISFEKNGNRIAFDICPVNIILNHLSQQLGEPFDYNGNIGRTGTIDTKLLNRLNEIDFYKSSPPKSVGREWLDTYFLPVAEEFNIPIQNKLRTIYQHIMLQIATCAPVKGKLLITGGGALNGFIIELLRQHLECEVIRPELPIIQFKEAIIFAFLGLLRVLGETNCYASVTGAVRDSITGVVHI